MSIHGFTVATASGSSYALSQLAGRNVLLVNTASRCGYSAMNMRGLTMLHSLCAPRLAILCFPCGQFANQEPLSALDAEAYNRQEFGCNGLIFCEKVKVKGRDAHPLWAHLANSSGAPGWNYNKYLCNAAGVPVQRFEQSVPPETLANDVLRMTAGLDA